MFTVGFAGAFLGCPVAISIYILIIIVMSILFSLK